jgi:hypothetical protein
MPSPIPSVIPSETTIEVLTNHFLLHHLKNPRAWIFCPTRKEEFRLGYDASMQNTKILIIQYKRLSRVNKRSLTITLNRAQHRTLTNRFRPLKKPYVFYCFSKQKSYHALGRGFLVKTGPVFFDNCVFFNAHNISPGTRSVNFEAKKGLRPIIGPRKYGNPIPTFDGKYIVSQLKSCPIGIFYEEFNESFDDRIDKEVKIQISVMVIPKTVTKNELAINH